MFTLLCGASEGCMKAFSSSPLKLTNLKPFNDNINQKNLFKIFKIPQRGKSCLFSRYSV